MARKDWTLTDGTLTCFIGTGLGEVSGDYDLTELFEDFTDLTSLQQAAIAYGVKQKLADCTARSKDMTLSPQEQVDTMTARYRTLIETQEWNEKGGGGGIAIASSAVKILKDKVDQLTPELKAALEAAGMKF